MARFTSWGLGVAALLLLTLFAGTAAAQGPPVAFLGVWDRAMPMLQRASADAQVPVAFVKAEAAAEPAADLGGAELIFILNFNPEQARPLRDTVRRLKAARPALRVIPLDRRDSHAELEQAGLLTHDPRVPLYWRANGGVNLRRLLRYAAITYQGASGEPEPPLVIPDFGFYHPEIKEVQPDLKSFQAARPWRRGAPTAAFLIQQSFWITEDTAVIDAQIRALEGEGFNVATFFAQGGEQMKGLLESVHPDLIIEDRHGSFWEGEDERSTLEVLGVPYLRPISMLGGTVEQWEASPQGLDSRDVSHFMTLQELHGTVDPLVVGGLVADIQGFRLHKPIPERVARFARRAKAWSNLKTKQNKDKKIAIIYYNKSLGRGDLMRGSPTGAFLDGPESLIRALPRLQAAGFQIEGAPADKEALLARIQAQGRNIAPWAQGELEAQAKSPDAVWVSVAALEAWMEQHLTPAQRAALERAFGPPPGELMVVKRGGEPGIVLPVLRLGSVVLAPQPERGATQDEQLLHSRDVPPPYNYIAFYAWLQDTFQADAIVHWGTHGSLELLPGKEAGLSGEDWSDLCTGSLPVINPWIMDNIGEATLSRRRSYALLVDHLPPPAVPAELTDELRLIHDDIDKFEALEAGALQESFRRRITEASREARLDETLKLDLSARLLTDAEIGAVTEYLHEVYNTTTPSSLHILGEAVSGERLAEYLVSILGRPFLEHLEAVTPVPPEAGQAEGDRTTWLRERGRVVVEESVLGAKRADPRLAEDVAFGRDMLQRLRRTELELTRLVEALEGRYIPPGPGPDPIRNPASAPSGRNLYALNPEEIPTRPSWEVGVQLVKDMLAEGEPPRKIGFDLNGMNTMRDYGVIEAQILYLLGARPIWDRNNLVVDVELIPREELGRPRIDVFIAMGGQYKENFPTRVALLDKAVRLVGAQEEPDNGVRAGTERTAARLKGRGLTPQQVEALAPARIFGTKPGNMSGTHILHLVPRSGVWEDEGEILSVYIDNMSYAYTGEIWGEKVDGLYEDAIQGTDTLIRVWASNMTSPLSNHHAYEYLGGLSMAVTELTGQEPRALIADVRDPNGARIRSFEEVLATNLRSELLNRKWIEGMQEHGYAGAGHIAELTKNTFGWSVTRRSAVSQGVWDDIYKIYIADNYGLDMQAWFDRENPHAMQEIAATMLEAHRKGYWSATPEQLDALAHRYARSVVEHGPSGGLVDGGNARLAEQVQGRLEAPADQALSEAYASALARAGGAAPMEAPPQVEGTRMEEVPPPQPPPPPTALDLWGWGVAALAALLLALGAWRRTGAPT